MKRLTLIALLLLVPGASRGDEIPTLEKQRGLVDGHRTRLEGLLGEQAKRIARLKSQPAGLQRDYQLGAALRENQTLADRLTKLRAQLRELTQKLIKEHDQTLARTGLSAAERTRLQRRRSELAATLSTGSTRIATGGKASPLDTPDDLEEKADLLQDSEEKVRKQLRQVQTKLAALEQRARVERHAKAADDNPFVEESPRRAGGTHKVPAAGTGTPAVGVTSPGAGRTTADPSAPPAATPSGKTNADSAESGTGFYGGGSTPGGAGTSHVAGGSSDTVISIRDVLDPSLLRDPTGAESRDSLRARIAALKQAGERLRQVAGKLSTQAGDLRRRAKTLRTTH
jgi:hypothetical protein